jgi:phosphatidylserine/phosphatidylglycerophosphate/cardiolipin synthase-like enzyme
MRRALLAVPFVVLGALVAALAGCPTAGPGDVDAGPDAPLPTRPLEPTTAMRLIVEPSDHGNGLVQAITEAKVSVHMTMFLLTSTSVMDALIAQHDAGHEVQVVLNPNSTSSSTSNSAAFNRLHGAGVDVRFAPTGFTFTHEKAAIIDGAEAWIMTMNATASSADNNREYLVVDTDPVDVAEADAIFRADFEGTTAPAAPHLVLSPGARAGIVAVINSATRTLDIEGEELSDTVIANAIISRRAAGVAVRIVIPSGTGSAAQERTTQLFVQRSVAIVKTARPYIHAKVIVADGDLAYVGSQNFTANSLDNNRELGVVFAVPAEIQKITDTITRDFQGGNAP